MIGKQILAFLVLFGLLPLGQAQASEGFSYRAKVLTSDTSKWPRVYLLLEVVNEKGSTFPDPDAPSGCRPATSQPQLSDCWRIELSTNDQQLQLIQQDTILDLVRRDRSYLWLSYLSNEPIATEQTLQVTLRTLGENNTWVERTKLDQAPLVVPVLQQIDISETPWLYLSRLEDTHLNQRWSKLPEALRKKLIAGQRAWIVYRDADCKYQSQSLPITHEQCLYQLTELRLLQLPIPENAR